MATNAIRLEKRPLHITMGVSEVFLNDIGVGVVRGVSFSAEWEDKIYESGQPLNEIARIRIREKATIKFTGAQFDEAAVQRALPDSQTITGATLIRPQELIDFSGGDTQTLRAKTVLVADATIPEDVPASGLAGKNVVVYSPPATPTGTYTYYLESTIPAPGVPDNDYQVDLTAMTITRRAAGTIPAGEVFVHYYYTDADATAITFGALGCSTPTFSDLRIHTKRVQDCVPIDILSYKVQATSPFTLSLAEEEFTQPELTYAVVGDLDRAEGDRLFRIIFGQAITG